MVDGGSTQGPLHRRPSSFSLLPALRLGSFLHGRRVKANLWSKASKLGSVPSKGDQRRFLEEVVDLFGNTRLRSLHPSPLPCSGSQTMIDLGIFMRGATIPRLEQGMYDAPVCCTCVAGSLVLVDSIKQGLTMEDGATSQQGRLLETRPLHVRAGVGSPVVMGLTRCSGWGYPIAYLTAKETYSIELICGPHSRRDLLSYPQPINLGFLSISRREKTQAGLRICSYGDSHAPPEPNLFVSSQSLLRFRGSELLVLRP
ncbi:hypothetical protein VNO77_03619 [Canavalia gladiata]|uniref:Uncharacterized protein n=1 Tax=Canavalia gladiata TaxID=3824 RepID=A0AAN9R432_CANGL